MSLTDIGILSSIPTIGQPYRKFNAKAFEKPSYLLFVRFGNVMRKKESFIVS